MVVFGATALVMLVLGNATLAAPAAVTIQSSSFVPPAVTVNLGETVTWTNRDLSQHTATATGVFDTGTLSMGQSRTIQMSRAGTFQYICVIHTFMTGSVTVVAPATPPPPTPIPPTPIPPTPRPVTPTPVTATPVRTVTPVPATAAPTAPPVPATAPPSESPPPTPASTVAATVAPSAVAQSSPTPRSDPPAQGSAAPAATDSGPGPALAAAAALLAVGVAGLVAYRARRR